jgi:hypothetical protein
MDDEVIDMKSCDDIDDIDKSEKIIMSLFMIFVFGTTLTVAVLSNFNSELILTSIFASMTVFMFIWVGLATFN